MKEATPLREYGQPSFPQVGTALALAAAAFVGCGTPAASSSSNFHRNVMSYTSPGVSNSLRKALISWGDVIDTNTPATASKARMSTFCFALTIPFS